MSAATHKLSDAVQRVPREGKVIFINPAVPAWFVTNRVGEAAMTLFDGHNTDEQVAATTAEACPGVSHDEALRWVQLVVGSRIFNEPAPRERHRSMLGCVHLSLTSGCNLRCKYCYAAEREVAHDKPLTLAEYRDLIDQIIAINPQVTFTLTGGEPLLNPHWAHIARHIKARGCEVSMLTNGTLITEAVAQVMAGCIDSVTLSIDGSNAATHALTRGRNFSKVTRAMRLLSKLGIAYSLSMTVTRLNIADVEQAARRWGARLSYAPLFPVSELSADDLSITGTEYFTALKNAAGVAPLSYCESSLDAAQLHPCHKCAIGEAEISISPTGDVYPCQLLHKAEFRAGNVRVTPIAHIYNDSAVMRQCRQLDVDTLPRCRDCAIRYVCGGACRARSYYESGSLTATGDFCVYEQEAYYDGIIALYSRNAMLAQ